ncbi:MAG TPA: hypothetical protein VMB80_15060 [Candidatus Acidoferrum sp.]|nr:hypothetical protein [Candidatus Acidoferrum sp.]
MKTWIYICAMLLAAGVMTVPAQNTPANPGNTNEAAAPPAAPAPAPTPAAVPGQAPAAPAAPKVAAPLRAAIPAPPASESPVTTHKAAATNVPPPTAAAESKSPEAEPPPPTNMAPAEGESPNAAPPTPAPAEESSGISHWTAVLVGAAILLAGGALGFFIYNRSGVVPHGSLITSALNELKKNPPGEDKDEDKISEPPAPKSEEKKKLEIKFPPPMT